MKIRVATLSVTFLLLSIAWLVQADMSARLVVPPSDIIFSHEFHVTEMEVECLTCHAGIESSTEANDRNLPEMETCGECHDVEDDETCEMCHATDDFEPVPDTDRPIVFNHQAHVSQGTPCERCHTGVGQADRLTEAHMPRMSTCFECHDGVTVDNDCALCHGTQLTLEDIHPGDWRHQHADRAAANRPWCEGCHTDDNSCLACHRGDNIDGRIHDLNYEFTHGLDAGSKKHECARCHEQKTFCSDCHEERYRIPLEHSSAGWLNDHGHEARRDPENCASCHDADDPTCARSGCHSDFDGILGTDIRIHSGGLSRFGAKGPWHDDDGYFCFQCHSSSQTRGVRFCGYCHN